MTKNDRPNLVLIMTDQQRFDTIRALGYSHMITPNLDAIAGKALRFHRAYCPGATCVASRASIFTGMYPHNTGAYTFMNWAHHRTWIEDLADHGYWCVNIGKMHFQPRDASGGFHERIIVENPTSTGWGGGFGDDAWGRYLAFHGVTRPNGRHRTIPDWRRRFQGVPWHLEEHLHSDVFIGNSAVAWIRQHRRERPLFLQVGFTGPHEPWDPMPRHLAMYEQSDVPAPVDFPGELSQKPRQHQAHKVFHANTDHESVIDMPSATEEDVRHMRHHYYAKITLVDEQIGRIVHALEEKGILDNSLLIFCSDHGEMAADHGVAYKWLMYESVTRVPLLMMPGSAIAKSFVGRDVGDLTSLIDIGPTFLNAAGITPPSYLEGQSLLGYVYEAPPPARRRVFCEDNYQIMMRGERYKIVIYLGQEEGELYDLQNDENEVNNLWGAAEAFDLRNQLKMELLEWVATSTYFNSIYKAREPNASLRWPCHGDFTLHGKVDQKIPFPYF